MTKKIVRPALQIQHSLETTLTREDFSMVMKSVRHLEKWADDWKAYYRKIKGILSPRLSQDQYQRVIKQLNIIVRPYRKHPAKLLKEQ